MDWNAMPDAFRIDAAGTLPFEVTEEKRKLVTILSIDGGGRIGSLFSATILCQLETELQKLDGPDARIAEYFDVIAGSSLGAMVPAMLTAPGENNRPKYTAVDIMKFYLEHCPKIFSQPRSYVLGVIHKVLKVTRGPIYDETYLYKVVRETLVDEFRLEHAMTNIVIPTFDITADRVINFSSYQLKKYPQMNAKISDICLGASAQMTYFPPYYFETKDLTAPNGIREFNLIGGDSPPKNPTGVALREVLLNDTDHNEFAVLSLGMGMINKGDCNSGQGASWGLMRWLSSDYTKQGPFFVTVEASNDELVHLHTLSILQDTDCYLWIKDYSMTPSLDVATTENMERVVQHGKDILLERPCSRFTEETNAMALEKFAEKLSREKNRRRRLPMK